MTNKWIFGTLAAAWLAGVGLARPIPVNAQVPFGPPVYAGYAPLLAGIEPPGCPLYGYGQWTFVAGEWVWCPPASVALAPPVGVAALSGYYGFGAVMPPATIAIAPAGYGYAPSYYGYVAPGYYSYAAPGYYSYAAPTVYGSPYYATSLTGSPMLDLVMGVAAASLISSAFAPNYGAAYYPQYGAAGPSYVYGGNTYARNVYRYTYNRMPSRRPSYRRRRIAFLRSHGASWARIARLRHSVGLNRQRMARQRAAVARNARIALGNRPAVRARAAQVAAERSYAPQAAAHNVYAREAVPQRPATMPRPAAMVRPAAPAPRLFPRQQGPPAGARRRPPAASRKVN